MPVSLETLRELLSESFARVEERFLRGSQMSAPNGFRAASDAVFESRTQAYREVVLGCLLTRISDRSRDVRLPYLDLDQRAFSGRSLDEQVVNPFLRAHDVPCSQGPYLSVFRRQVRFDHVTRAGVRDKKGYDAFLEALGVIETESDHDRLVALLEYVLCRFVLLREQSRVDLVLLDRISLGQCSLLTQKLLARSSGGLFPIVLTLAMVRAISARFSLGWTILFQGLNVADRASGAGGDITVKALDETVLTIEVTERPVDATRVQTTFKEKIATRPPSDYVFLVHLSGINVEARQQAERYFTQGYDVNFVDIGEWLLNTLVTVGAKGRRLFQQNIAEQLSENQVPKALKVAWNDEIQNLTLS